MTDVVESKPCDVRRWSGCRNIPKMSTNKPTLSLSSSKYFLFIVFPNLFVFALKVKG